MPRKQNLIRPVRIGVHLPEDVVAKVELELYSEVEKRVPYGAWSGLLTGLVKEWLAKREGQS